MSHKKITLKDAVSAIQRRGILLVYPLGNQKEPPSLWSEFYPRSEMRWEWDTGGDDRVANLWHLREELARSGKVVYAKWYRGRATFFSLEVFKNLLAILESTRTDRKHLLPEARLILETLESDSPLSTKQIKLMTDFRGKFAERVYEKSMKALWTKLLIVGYGAVADGAFPSLSVGATRHLFEALWQESEEIDPRDALAKMTAKIGPDSPFLKFLSTIRG